MNGIKKLWTLVATAAFCCLNGMNALAWDHPGHMAIAAIAFDEIERARPELIEKIGALMLKHPDPAPFWVAAGEARGKELARRMFIQASRWPDDARWTINDRPAWHSARWAVVADDAPPEARKLAEARHGHTSGQAVEALTLNAAVLSDPESKAAERALALSWLLHIMGDIHQPLHTADLYSAAFPTGNPAGAMGFVQDPLADSAMQLHLLWDSNDRRSVEIEHVDGYADAIMKQFPRSSLPELKPFGGPDDFETWARASYQEAADWAFDIEMIPDPEQDPDKVVQKMILYILEGVSPVEGAPAVPDEYWAKLQDVAPRRMALAGYRIADIIIAAADRIDYETSAAREALDAVEGRPGN
jgi:hypothetical protein